jgi:Domain of unknown function (DUF4407)/CHAT domain
MLKLTRVRRMILALSGANEKVLDLVPGERARLESTGWFILLTGCVAAVSMWFALSSAIGINGFVAAPVALLWGLVAIGIDRWIVTSIRIGGRRRLSAVVPRLLLTLLLGTVISVPLVLRVFQPEINAQIAVRQQKGYSSYLARPEVAAVNAQVDTYHDELQQLDAVINSHGAQVGNPATDPLLAAYRQQLAQLNALLAAQLTLKDHYYAEYSCELYGGAQCPKKGVGSGAAASFKNYQQAAQQAAGVQTQVSQLEEAIQQREQLLTSDSENSQQLRYTDALSQRAGVQAELNAALQRKEQLQAAYYASEQSPPGLLTRIEALDELGGQSPVVASARILLFLLFLTLASLPVSAKLLQRAGMYEVALMGARDAELRTHRPLVARVAAPASTGEEGSAKGWSDIWRIRRSASQAYADVGSRLPAVPSGTLQDGDAVSPGTPRWQSGDSRGYGSDPGHGLLSGEDASPDRTAGEPSARFLTGMLPESAPAGRRISLMVQVTLAGQPGASAPLKPMEVPPGGCSIIITVTAQGLMPLGDLEQDLHVPAAADSEPIRFGFMTGRAGLHRMVVRAFAAGTFVGELALQVSVEAGGMLAEGPVRTAVLAGLVAEPGEVTLQVSRTDEDRYSFQLIGEAFYPVELTRRLAGDPADVVRALTEELRAMAAQESRYTSPALVRNRIRSLGAQLWADVVPDTIRRQFWEQAGRIKLFTVASDMDTVPWELLYPIDGDNDGGFLVEQFPVVRRVYGQSRARQLALSSAAYVVPPGSPANAMDEVEIVKARLGDAVRHYQVCSRLDTLLGLLEDSPSVLHFACHNDFNDRTGSVISLDGGPLRPSDLTPARQTHSMARSNPLVFLNACRTAGEVPSLMEMMGWARQFMGAGAGAFVGSLWAIRSSSARSFADAFYRALVDDRQPLGAASLQARRAIAEDEGDPTWLAYTIYGNPAATIR